MTADRVYIINICDEYRPAPGETLSLGRNGWAGSRYRDHYADRETAIQALTADGWELVENNDSTMVFCHPATLQAKEERDAYLARKEWEASHAGKWANAKSCYLRFGKVPACGYSINHADGSAEAGVSVYRGERLTNGTVRPVFETNQEWVGWMNFLAKGVTLYIVTGEELDACGSDGEPLLANCRIWRKARNIEA